MVAGRGNMSQGVQAPGAKARQPAEESGAPPPSRHSRFGPKAPWEDAFWPDVLTLTSGESQWQRTTPIDVAIAVTCLRCSGTPQKCAPYAQRQLKITAAKDR